MSQCTFNIGTIECIKYLYIHMCVLEYIQKIFTGRAK